MSDQIKYGEYVGGPANTEKANPVKLPTPMPLLVEVSPSTERYPSLTLHFQHYKDLTAWLKWWGIVRTLSMGRFRKNKDRPDTVVNQIRDNAKNNVMEL